MKKTFLSLILFLLFMMGCASDFPDSSDSFTNKISSDRMLIVIAAPSVNEPYYAEVFEQIIEYDIQFAQAVMGHDNILVLADNDTLPYLKDRLPADILLESDVIDIWMRDFSTISPERMVAFEYAPDYLSSWDSTYIQNSFKLFARKYNLSIEKSGLVLDGGNVVDNHVDKAILTTRVLSDNPDWTREQIIGELQDRLGVESVALIPEEAGDTTGHSDGMVMWVSENTLLINQYDEPFRSQVLDAIYEAMPDVEIVEVEADYQYAVWKDFVSACGLNANSILTNHFIYVPTFGNPQDDVFIEMIQLHTEREIITIDAQDVCFMGGSVRCLAWQVTGENAEKLILAARGE
jgi:agmatine/peptidylarginine deiminase